MRRLLTIVCLLIALLSYAQVDTFYFENIEIENPTDITRINKIQADSDGNLWLSTQNGLYTFDGYRYHLYKESNLKKHGLKHKTTRGLFNDKKGDLWVAGAYSTYRHQSNKHILERTSEQVHEQYGDLYFISYFDIEEIDDYMLFASKIGLQFFSKKEQKVTHVDTLFKDLVRDGYSTNYHIIKIERDVENPNNVWLLTRKGLIYYNTEIQKPTLIPSSGLNISFEDMAEQGSDMCIHQGQIYILVNFLKLFKYDIKQKKWIQIKETFDKRHKGYKRNILPYKDGILITYIELSFYYYDHLKKKMFHKIAKNIDSKDKMSLSSAGIDHNGHLVFIQNNRNLVRSTEAIFPVKKTPEKIFYRNLKINQIANDTFSFNEVLDLKKHERDISFSIGLNHHKSGQKEFYYYRFRENKPWIISPSRHLEIKDLPASTSHIYTRLESAGRIYEGPPILVSMEKYAFEKLPFLILLGLILSGIIGSISYLLYSKRRDRKKHTTQILQLEMDALRSQMNPHFLFNSLNSIKNYVVSRTKDEAADYITSFSKLIRMILENSRKKFIELEEELKMLKLYIEMENKRLNGTLQSTITVHPDIPNDFKLAPMLLQPYVENAIWHGLMHKKGSRELSISFTPVSNGIKCTIRDNGVGREYHKKNTSFQIKNKKSLGTSITSDRVKLINQTYGINNEVQIIDLKNDKNIPLGTEIQIHLPQLTVQAHD